MKAVITEIREKKAVLLFDDGRITKIKNKGYELGQEVDFMKTNSNFKKAMTFAAAACFLLISGGSVFAYYTPSSYVSLDVNPSIEFSVNIFDRVIKITGVNDDGTEIINEISIDNLKNKNIADAVNLIVDEISKEGYLESDDAGIVISTSSEDMDKADELAQKLEDTATEACEENNAEVTVTAEAVGKKRVDEARELGVTPGKLNLVEKLKESSEDPDSIDMNEWLNKPVKEIMAQTKENKKDEKSIPDNKKKNEQSTTQETTIPTDTQISEKNTEQNSEQEMNSGAETQIKNQNANKEKNSDTQTQVKEPKPNQGKNPNAETQITKKSEQSTTQETTVPVDTQISEKKPEQSSGQEMNPGAETQNVNQNGHTNKGRN